MHSMVKYGQGHCNVQLNWLLVNPSFQNAAQEVRPPLSRV